MHQDKGQSLTCADVDDPVTLPAPLHEAAAHECHRCLRQAAPCCHIQHLQVAHFSQAAGKASSMITSKATSVQAPITLPAPKLAAFDHHRSHEVGGGQNSTPLGSASSQPRQSSRQEKYRCQHAGGKQMSVAACQPGAGDAPLC